MVVLELTPVLLVFFENDMSPPLLNEACPEPLVGMVVFEPAGAMSRT